MATQSPPDKPVAPDPKFWSKYSPNQEFPISSLTSVALHVAAAVLLVLFFGYFIGGSRDSAMPVEVLDDGFDDAGGGGSPTGGAINNTPGQPRVERAREDEIPANTPAPTTSMTPLPDPKNIPDLPDNPNADRAIDSGDAKSKLDKAGQAPSSGNPNGSTGRGGVGSSGGAGNGAGPGDGSGNEAGSQGSIRQKRNKRWTLSFNVTDGPGAGRDYLRQLALLGAILVGENADGTQLMYRQLDRSPVPAEPVGNEIRNLMRWVDERPSAVRDLSEAMGIDRTPAAIKAYFPYKLENELLNLEKNYRGKKEEEIHSTVFRVFLEGSRYRLVVSEQKYNQ